MTGNRIGDFLRAATVPAAGTVSNVRELHRAFCSWSGTRPALGEFLLIAADIVTGAFDMNDLAVLEQFGNLFVLLPFIALGIRFEN